MKVQELVNIIGDNKNKQSNVERLQAILKKNLNVKEYLGIKAKKNLIDSIVSECILYDNGVFKFDDIDKYICFTMRTIEAYTTLELSDDIENDYDLLCQSGLLEMVVNTFKKEYDDVNILLQMKCAYILSDNNIEAQVGKFLTELLDKVDVFVNALSNKVDGFSFDNLPINEKDLNKLLEFVGKVNKE